MVGSDVTLPRLRVRPLGYAITATGALIALFSLAAMSWIHLTGPNVLNDPAHPSANLASGAIVYVNPGGPTPHTTLVWALFGLCVIAAIGSGVPRVGWPMAARVIAPALAGLLIIAAILSVVVPGWVLDQTDALTAGNATSIEGGFWVALAGYVMIGIGAALGPRSSSE